MTLSSRSAGGWAYAETIRPLWLLIGFLMPLFALTYGRVDMGIYHLPLPAFGLALVTLAALSKPGFLLGPLKAHRLLGLSILALITSHFLAFLKAGQSAYALREFIKLSSGLCGFWILLATFPQTEGFLTWFLLLTVFSTSLLLSSLIIQYAFIFREPYLGTYFHTNSTLGKNHLAWFLSATLPYALTLKPAHRFLRAALWASIVIFFTALIYIMSRAAWASSCITLAVFTIAHLKFGGILPAKKKLLISLLGVLMAFGAIAASNTDLAKALPVRVQSMFDPGHLPEGLNSKRLGKHSYEIRLGYLKTCWETFKKNPISGIGLSQAEWGNYFGEAFITHNDYFGAFLETGLLGGIPLLLSLGLIGLRLMRKGNLDPKVHPFALAALCSFISVLFFSNFINIYSSVHYWLILGLAVLSAGITRDGGFGGPTEQTS